MAASTVFAAYAGPAFSIWGGQEYSAVPDVSGAGGRVIIRRSYVVNHGKSVRDGVGNTYSFGYYQVKDTYYYDSKKGCVVLSRKSNVSMTISGTFAGSVTINETQHYQQYPGFPLQQISTNQVLSENLTQGKATGTSTQTLNFRFSTGSTPPSYGTVGMLPIGYSFSSGNGEGKPTAVYLSGSLCLSSQPNKPCPLLTSQSTYFKRNLGWSVQGILDSMAVKAGTFSNISVLGQVEPFIAMQYSTGCSTGPCLTSPASGNSREVTTWVAPGIGVIKYQGPFYVPGAIVTYELRKMPVMSQ